MIITEKTFTAKLDINPMVPSIYTLSYKLDIGETVTVSGRYDDDASAIKELTEEMMLRLLNQEYDEKTEEFEKSKTVDLSTEAELEDGMRDAYKRLTGELEALEERVKTLENKESSGGYPWPGTWPPYNPAQPYTPITDPVNPVTPSDPVWPSYPVTPGYPTSPWTTPWFTWQYQPWWQYYTTTTSDTANTTSNLKK